MITLIPEVNGDIAKKPSESTALAILDESRGQTPRRPHLRGSGDMKDEVIGREVRNSDVVRTIVSAASTVINVSAEFVAAATCWLNQVAALLVDTTADKSM